MVLSYEDAIKELKKMMEGVYIGIAYQFWYCGVTNDIDSNYNRHGKPHPYYYVECKSAEEASSVEKYFLDKGCQGNTGGWAETSVYVYVYKV